MGQTRKLVLVVDDSITVRKVIERVLEARGVQVISAKSGREAMERIEQDRPDLVISDVVMPDKNGYDICTFVRQHPQLAATPVLLISGVVDPTVRARAATVRSTDVIGKPFSHEDLASRVDELLARRAPEREHPSPAASPPPTSAARRPPRPAPTPTPSEKGFADWVDRVGRMPGVQLVVLADRQGLLLESSAAGGAAVDDAVSAGLAACCAEATQGIGEALGQGRLDGIILEYERGVLLARYVGNTAILGVLLRDPAFLGKVRYLLKRADSEVEAQATSATPNR